MEQLLFLAHRIPYPPNKGDKIRSFNLLKHLSRHYRVHLGTFIDDPHDCAYRDEVRAFCGETCFIDIDPRWRRLRCLRGLFDGQPLTLPYYHHPGMQDWVDTLLADHPVERVLVFSSAMAQYVSGPRYQKLHRVIDFVDVDSEKWRQYAARKPWPLSWLYRREGRLLLAYERQTAVQADAGVFVTAAEADLFKRLAPEVSAQVTAIGNGVDTDYFDPSRDYPNPYEPDERALVFTGAMDYWANVDAVVWFAREVFRQVREEVPEARFYIVGARPAEAVRRLAREPGVVVTGAVRDIRPYLAHARAAVAPLRIARGVQNKVLEAMAMAKPVLATTAAMDGIEIFSELRTLVADEADALAVKAREILLEGRHEALGGIGRGCVRRHFDWPDKLRRIEALLERSGQTSGIRPFPAMEIPAHSLISLGKTDRGGYLDPLSPNGERARVGTNRYDALQR